MTIVISDLVARVRADGVEQATAAVKTYGDQAAVTARALQIMAEAATKQPGAGGSVQSWMEIFQKSNIQPTAAAMAQAAQEMQNTAAAAAQAVQPTQTMARAAQNVADGWKLSESSLVRFGTALIGVNLGISLVAGAARQIHNAIAGVVDAQLSWERSLIQVRALWGDIAPNIVATAQAQAQLPGVLGSQTEFTQAAIGSRYLTSRYGVPAGTVTQLTTAAGRVAGALGIVDAGQRAALQQQFLQFAESGGTGLREFGIEGTPLGVARRLGYSSEAGLQALTPGDLRQVQALMAVEGANRLAATATNQGSLLARRSQLDQALNLARGNLAQFGGAATVEPLGPELTGRLPGTPYANLPPALPAQVGDLARELADITKSLGDATQAADDARDKLNKLGVEAGGAAARLLTFSGSIEDRYSIARGDVGAQSLGGLAGRMRMALPGFGTTQGEIVSTGVATAWQQAYQNYVAFLAQQEQGNPIQEYLQGVVQYGPAAQRPAAARALTQARLAEPVQIRINEAERTGQLVQLQTAEMQSRLEEITLQQRERGVRLLRETVDLRKLDNEQQQIGVRATLDVVRAQQAGLPAQYALQDAQYQTTRASVLASARMARLLQGKDVSGLPSPDELIRMNVQGQLSAAEAGPAALAGSRGIEIAQRTATAAGLAQQLTAGQLQLGDLSNDLKNLGDLPSQTALMLEDIQNSRDSLSVQREIRDLQKDLVRIMTGRPPSSTNDQAVQDIANRIAVALFGDDSGGNAAAPDMPANRRGPF